MMPRPAASPPQLKWHNTLPQDFAGCQVSSSGATPSRNTHKRHISSPNDEPVSSGTAYCQKQTSFNGSKSSRSTVLASPTKRHRSSEILSALTTPVKLQAISSTVPSAGSGMQTPPPSSMGKRRGRPPKGSGIVTNVAEFAGNSPLNSPSKVNTHMQDVSDFITPITMNPHQNISGEQNSQANLILSTSKADSNGVAGIYEIPDPIFSSEWADLPSSVGDFDNDLPEIFATDQFYHLPSLDQTDPTAFSFQGDPEDFNCVDPNLLFSSRATSDQSSQVDAPSDDLEHGLSPIIEKPYQHQHNYRKRERELELKRQKMKERALKQKSFEANGLLAPRSGTYDPSALRHSISEGILPYRKESSFKASKLDAVVSRGLVRSITPPTSRGGSVPKTPKVKTEVVFSISPSGRAKSEAKMTLDSDTEVDMTPSELEDLKNLEESQESDSSLDDPEPRGLAPDGKCYRLTRKQKDTHSTTPSSKPRIGIFQVTPMTEYTRNFDWDDSEEETETPSITSESKPNRPTSMIFDYEKTSVKHQNIIDHKAFSSSRLPTPRTSSPSKENRRRIASTTATSNKNDIKHNQPASDESEAETVVDQSESPSTRPVSSAGANEGNGDGNALEALKTLMKKRRAALQVTSPGKSSISSRPGSSSKHHVFSAGTHSVISRANPLSVNQTVGRKTPLFSRKPLRRSRTMPDGGYALLASAHEVEAGCNTSSTEEDNDVEGIIRCICGMNEDGGRMMIQCDSCNGWLHLKCVGLPAKSIPETFACAFCHGENQRPRGGIRRSGTLPQQSSQRSR